MRVRSIVVVALAAVLLGAPSRVSGAGNALASPSVTPTAGTTATAFAFTVRYEGNFPALGVSVQVAGLSVPMLLVGGSPSGGTWSATLTLPAGTWPVSFVATVERGNPAEVAGPTLTVAGAPSSHAAAPVTIPATPTVAPNAPTSRRSPTVSTPAVEPAAPPAPVATAAPIAQPVASPPAAPTEQRPPAPYPQPPPTARPTSATPEPAPRAGTAGSSAPSTGQPAQSASGATFADASPPVGIAREPVDAQPSGEVTDAAAAPLGIGLAGLAAVALLGTGLIVLGRRRRSDEEVRAASAAAAGTSAVLERRAIRRARVRLDEDPVVAALGIGQERPASTARPRTPPAPHRPHEPPDGRD